MSIKKEKYENAIEIQISKVWNQWRFLCKLSI